MKAGPKIYKSS